MKYVHNQVQLSGRAGHPPELFTMTDGTMMARLRLYQSFTNHSGERSSMAFSIVAWGGVAESLHQTVFRGDHLFIIGRLRIRTWKQEGINHLRPEVHLEHYHLIKSSLKKSERGREAFGEKPCTSKPESS